MVSCFVVVVVVFSLPSLCLEVFYSGLFLCLCCLFSLHLFLLSLHVLGGYLIFIFDWVLKTNFSVCFHADFFLFLRLFQLCLHASFMIIAVY